ncbi:MAG: vanadium-dependent haloperoxidase [Chitinophagaceae bacterium]
MKRLILLLMLIVFITSCKQSNYTVFTSDPSIYSKTVKELNNIVLENNFPPMIAARNYVYANIAAYECVVAGDSKWNSLSGQVQDLKSMPKPSTEAKIDFSLASLLAFVKVGNAVTFPDGSMMSYYDLLIHEADSMGISSKMLNDTKDFADQISNAILNWSKGDNYAKTRGASRFNVDQTEGRWVPTPPMYATALEPHWMEIRPLVLDSASQFMAPRPPGFDVRNKNSEYYKAMMEVKNTVEQLTDEQKHIADFWDDNPFKMNVTGHVMFATKKFSPAGHWMNIVGIGAQHAKADFNTTIAAYAETSIALFDAFIACWDEKYRSNYIRPETAINKYVDTDWQPYIQTPPFPSYTSGHSTISAASAEVMTAFFGEQHFTDTSLLEFGIANREIKSFREAAQEASISRLFGGIHYRFDLDEGNKVGKKIGEHVVGKLQLKKK